MENEPANGAEERIKEEDFTEEDFTEEDFKAEIRKRASDIEQILSRYLPKEEGFQKCVMEAMNYSVRSGGKRLRPMLMLETYRMFGGSGTVIEPFLAAIEMIHAYSLVHDDLPAMDNDEYRRGRKTTHVVYGEAMGILAGDGLLNYAFETAASAFSMKADPGRTAKAFQVLAKKSGIYGMIGGQAVDVQNEGTSISADMLDFIYRLKTGALLEASMMAGAILAGADDEQVSLAEQAAGKAGMAFQIQDDILDVSGTFEELGKPIGSDAKNSKTTYVTLYGIEAAQSQVQKLTQEARQCMDRLPVRNVFLNRLLRYLAVRRS